METLLPNGSIILLKGGNKRLLIYGRKQLVQVRGRGNSDPRREINRTNYV